MTTVTIKPAYAYPGFYLYYGNGPEDLEAEDASFNMNFLGYVVNEIADYVSTKWITKWQETKSEEKLNNRDFINT